MKMHYKTIEKLEKLLSEKFGKKIMIFETNKEMKGARYGEFAAFYYDDNHIEKHLTGVYDFNLKGISQLKLH